MSRVKGPRRHLSYANVVATLALVIAVAGIPTAVAVTSKPGKNTVTTKSIKRGNVTAKDLAEVRVATAQALGGAVAENLRATCEPNERLIGGGGEVLRSVGTPPPPFSPALRVSRPDGNSWLLSANGDANGIAYALCLSPKPTKKGK